MEGSESRGRKQNLQRKKYPKQSSQSQTPLPQPSAAPLMAAVRFLIFFCFLLSLSHSQPPPTTAADALLNLKESLSPPNVFTSWNPDSVPCKSAWAGVMCDNNGNVIGLHLSNRGISGNLDITALLPIASLRSIDLTGNAFSGTIPEFNKLKGLRSLYLTKNQFGGEIPGDYFAPMVSLRRLWLAQNNFTGKIPESLMQLSLFQLHLDSNQFSGPIPPAKPAQGLQTSFDLSNNKLDGPIPDVFAEFNASSFAGNGGLCGPPLQTECSAPAAVDANQQPSPTEETGSSGSSLKVIITILLLLVLIFVLLVAIRNAKNKAQPKDDVSLKMEPLSRDIERAGAAATAASDPSSRKSSTLGSSRGSATMGSKKGSSRGSGKKGVPDITMVNEEKGTFVMQDLMKAAAEVLGNGSLGSAYKAKMVNGVSVVVKRMKEMNKLGKESFDAELRRFGMLKNANVLTPLAYHFRNEEKLFISEFMPKGSLLFVLHGDRGTTHSELNWTTRLKIVKGIARGLSYIHQQFSSFEVPHGNLKSSNVLLKENYEPVLSDYCFVAFLNTPQAAQALFAYKSPEYLQHQQISPKADIFCLGILILETVTGKFPSQYLSNTKGGIDVVQWAQSSISQKKESDLIDPEISDDLLAIDQMVQLLQIGVACAESNPEDRPTLAEAVKIIEEIKPPGGQEGQER